MSMLKSFFKSKELKTFFIVFALFVLVGLKNSDFLSISNIMMLLNGSVIYIIASIGIAFVIMTGEIDVSIGATIGLSAAVSATLIRDGSNWFVAILVAIVVGLVIGLINGVGVTVFNIPSIIMTLGTNGIFRGLTYVYTDGKWVENLPYAFTVLAKKCIAGNITYFLLGVIVLMLRTL